MNVIRLSMVDPVKPNGQNKLDFVSGFEHMSGEPILGVMLNGHLVGDIRYEIKEDVVHFDPKQGMQSLMPRLFPPLLKHSLALRVKFCSQFKLPFAELPELKKATPEIIADNLAFGNPRTRG